MVQINLEPQGFEDRNIAAFRHHAHHECRKAQTLRTVGDLGNQCPCRALATKVTVDAQADRFPAA